MTRVLPVVDAPVATVDRWLRPPDHWHRLRDRRPGRAARSGRRTSSNIPVSSTALGERVARFAAVRHTSYVHLRRLDRPSPDRLELVSDLTPGWRLSELLDAIDGGEHSRRHHGRHRPAATAVAGGRAVWPPQPRCRDRRARSRASDRHAAGAPGDCRARLRPGARKAESRPRPPLARSSGRVAAVAGAPRANQRADAHGARSRRACRSCSAAR